MDDKKDITLVIKGDLKFSDADVQDCIELNEWIRESEAHCALGIRRCLIGLNCDVKSVIFAELFPDAECNEFGVFLTPEGKIFEFDYWYDESNPAYGEIKALKENNKKKDWNSVRAARVCLIERKI
jgi:hypothetical protein